MSTFLELVQDLQREVGVQGAPISTVVGQTNIYAKLVRWIADADMHIQSKAWDWNFLWSPYSVNTGIGNAEPTIPSDLNVWDETSFYLDYSTASHRHLKKIDYEKWRNGRGRGVLTNRKPDSFTIKPNNQLVLVNPPDAIYALTGYYWKTSTKMSANSDESNIPAQFQRTIVVQAKLWYAEQQDMPDLYKEAYAELYGNKKDVPGLLQELKSNQLPGQKRRLMGNAGPITIRPE